MLFLCRGANNQKYYFKIGYPKVCLGLLSCKWFGCVREILHFAGNLLLWRMIPHLIVVCFAFVGEALPAWASGAARFDCLDTIRSGTYIHLRLSYPFFFFQLLLFISTAHSQRQRMEVDLYSSLCALRSVYCCALSLYYSVVISNKCGPSQPLFAHRL